jgi:hypothetical protein
MQNGLFGGQYRPGSSLCPEDMLKQCAWCGLLMSGPHQGERVSILRWGGYCSHGICKACAIRVQRRAAYKRVVRKAVTQVRATLTFGVHLRHASHPLGS